MPPTLSQELIDEIIDYVAADPYTGPDDGYEPLTAQDHLRACALVSRAFRGRAQHHLFRRIKMSGGPSMHAMMARELAEIVSGNPAIIERHTKEFMLEFNAHLELSFTHHVRAYLGKRFIELVKKISTRSPRSLRAFAMSTEDDLTLNSDDLMSMKDDSKSFLDSFFIPFAASSITSLSLHRISDVPVELLTSCANLVNLDLMHVRLASNESAEREYWYKPDAVRHKEDTEQTCYPLCFIDSPLSEDGKLTPPAYQHYTIKLQSLAQRLSRHTVAQLLDWNSGGEKALLDLSQLRKYSIYTDDMPDSTRYRYNYPRWSFEECLRFEQKIVDMTCESLEEVEIITLKPALNYKFYGSLDLQQCAQLRALHAHVLFPEDSLVSVRQTLASVRAGSLHRLCIGAKVSFGEKGYNPDAVLQGDWAAFCAEVTRVMARGAQFDFRMTYCCTHSIEGYDYDELDIDELDEILPRLAKEALAVVREEKIAPLVGNPGLVVTTSLAIEYEYGWDW